MLKRTWIAVGFFVLGFSAPGFGSDLGLYIGVGPGHANAEDVNLEKINTDGSIVSGSTDDASRALKVFVGYQIIPYLAVEGEWINNLWKARIDAVSDGSSIFLDAGPVTHRGEADGLALNAVFNWPVAGPLNLYAKVGALWWKVDADLEFLSGGQRMQISDEDDGVDPTFGVGVRYDLGDALALRGEWQRFHGISETNSNVLWVSLSVGF